MQLKVPGRAACALLIVFTSTLMAFGVPGLAAAQIASAPDAGTGTIQGVITTQTTIPLGGVMMSLLNGSDNAAQVASEGDGTFKFEKLAPGRYTVTAIFENFETITKPAVVIGGSVTNVPFDLRLAITGEQVEVVAPNPVVPEAGTLSSSESVSQQELEQISPGGGVQSALRLIAGVIEVPGGISIKGGRPSQAGMQLGPGMFVDAATGLSQGSLPDDAIDSVTVLPNPYAVEFGRFSSGLVVVNTRRATDKWRTRLNQLDPAFRNKRHTLLDPVGISSFNPRFETGGPLVKNKLFLLEAVQYRYRTTEIASLPPSDLVTSQRFSSFTRLDANLSPKHTFNAVGGFFPSVYHDATLGTFVPPNATVDTHGDVKTAGITERSVWTDNVYSETTLEMNQFNINVVPQGTAPLELMPEAGETQGNFFNHQRRDTATYQLLETVSGTYHGGGLHLYKAGIDVLHTDFNATSVSQPVLIYRSDGTLARRLDFGTSGPLRIHTDDFAVYAQDRLQPSTRWYLEVGGRLDRDAVVNQVNFTPRVGAAVLLNDSGTAVIRAGYGLFFERTPSVAGVFNQYESYTDTRYAADGVTTLGPPVQFQHMTMPDLKTSRSRTWDAAFDDRLNAHWALHLGVIDREGRDELVVNPVSPLAGADGSALALQSTGRSQYREAEIGLHFTAGNRADLNATYARSQARANLNSFTTFFDSVLSPVVGVDQYAPARADVPNRLLGRGRFMPTPRWLVVAVVDWRTGLPYSTVNEMLDFVGSRNSQRFPSYFRLDLGLERRFKIFGHQPWIGVRADNALNSFLPADVQANITSPAYQTFYNSEYRVFRLQIRFE
jgi:hypothetical protein